jgi:hypothetical protein
MITAKIQFKKLFSFEILQMKGHVMSEVIQRAVKSMET